MQIAFYKGKGGWFNKAIRLWTRSNYTHVELIIDDVWYSSSHTDGGVRSRVISGDSGNWDIYEVDGDSGWALLMYEVAEPCKYDWFGIFLSQVLPLGLHMNNRYFCSELVGEMLQIDGSHRYSPIDLFNLLKCRGMVWA